MAEIKMMTTPAESGLAAQFEAVKGSLPGDAAARNDAFRAFAARGLPHRRIEDWKYTDLRALMREAAPLAAKPAGVPAVRAPLGAEALRVVIANGHVVAMPASLPEGVEIVPLASAMASRHEALAGLGAVAQARDNAAYQLNAAFVTDGAIIRIAPGASVETPIHLAFVAQGEMAFSTATRVLLEVGEGASVAVLESHEGPDGVGYQPNGVVEILAGDQSRVRHVRLGQEGSEALVLSTLTARLGAEVAFDSINVVLGGAVTRHQVYLAFAGEGTNAGIRGATMIKGRQHADTTLVVDHAVPGCNSRELFKTVVDGAATGVFQGKIIVAPDAQKTDGKMMSAAVLLSDEGTMNNKPELEIFADDVQCAHGATCGELDEDLLFYIMARGVPKPQAEALLIESFLGEAVEEGVEDEGVREALMGVIEDWLAARA